MRFLDRNRDKTESDAPTASSAADSLDSRAGEDAGQSGFMGRISVFLDSGRSRAMLESSMPERTTIAQILLGMIIGMITAYLIHPNRIRRGLPAPFEQQRHRPMGADDCRRAFGCHSLR